jgi:hypothetical protein
MPPADLPLQSLAQRLAEKQAELEDARRAYEARLSDLKGQRAALQAQLQAVDAEIQAVSATAVPAAPGPPPARPPKTKPAKTARAPKAAGRPSLSRLLVELVGAAARAMTIKELTEAVRARVTTTSSNLSKMVSNKVAELVKRGQLRRAEGQAGVVRASPAKQASAPKPTPASGTAATGRKGGTTPTQPPVKAGALSLRDLLLQLLTVSTRPLKARELAEQALATGYQTESKDFVNVVWVALGKLDEVENIPGQGYRMKKRSAGTK